MPNIHNPCDSDCLPDRSGETRNGNAMMPEKAGQGHTGALIATIEGNL